MVITLFMTKSINVSHGTGACVDIKSGCMFVITADPDSYEYENGAVETYCSMTGNHIRCLVPILYEPCGAMVLISDDRLFGSSGQGGCEPLSHHLFIRIGCMLTMKTD